MVAYKAHPSATSFIAIEISLALIEAGGVVKSIADIRDALKLSDSEFELGLAWCVERRLINIDDEGSTFVH